MISASQALDAILACSQPLPPQRVPMLQALNRIAAESVFASLAYPCFDQSSMDGYALRAEDTQLQTPLKVVGEQPAGKKRDLSLNPGEAIRIFTGAPMPQGANAAIMQEDVERLSADLIQCKATVELGENIRRHGSEIALGQKGVSKGQRITPATLAWLASQGHAEVPVVAHPRIAIIATGDELVTPGQTLEAGQIYESNSVMLAALCQSLGVQEVECHRCEDQLASTSELIESLQDRFDVLLFSGGVSVGDHDHVKPALHDAGFHTEFWRVAIKPGKPLVFATRETPSRTTLAFGLPGNPVSAWVTFALFVKPCLQALAGQPQSANSPTLLPLSGAFSNPDRRDHYLRGTVRDGHALPVGAQVSHGLQGLSQATHLIRIPAASDLASGTLVEVLPIF